MSFPKKGKVFPKRHANAGYAAAIAEALRSDLGQTRQAVKTLVKWTGVNERTAKNWIAGSSGPNGAHLIDLMRNSDAVFGTLLHLVGKEQALVATRLLGARGTVWEIVQMLDGLLAKQSTRFM